MFLVLKAKKLLTNTVFLLKFNITLIITNNDYQNTPA